MGVDWSLREGYAWAEDKEHCEEYGRMLQADPNKVSSKAKKRGLPQVSQQPRHPNIVLHVSWKQKCSQPHQHVMFTRGTQTLVTCCCVVTVVTAQSLDTHS